MRYRGDPYDIVLASDGPTTCQAARVVAGKWVGAIGPPPTTVDGWECEYTPLTTYYYSGVCVRMAEFFYLRPVSLASSPLFLPSSGAVARSFVIGMFEGADLRQLISASELEQSRSSLVQRSSAAARPGLVSVRPGSSPTRGFSEPGCDHPGDISTHCVVIARFESGQTVSVKVIMQGSLRQNTQVVVDWSFT